MAGYRGPQAEIGFLFFRLVAPIGLFLFALFYVFVLNDFGQPFMIKAGIAIAAAYLGIKAPEVFLSNQIGKRQASMRIAFPDALDLLLICVESGMSMEHACRKVAGEISTQSIPLAEEFALCTAELAYLAERRQAYENLAQRTGLESVKSVSTALIQAERYGTPLGTALRTLAQESRDQRMMAAEKKAASLPPKLTVPMILFFLPVLFIVIMTPAMIQVFKMQ
jgi:tight adherence protein C